MKLLNEDAIAEITIRGEAEGESYKGKICVGEVIRNRAAIKWFSWGDIISTCLMPMQFSCWNAKSANRLRIVESDSDDPNVKECQAAWVESSQSNYTGGAIMYHAKSILPPWTQDFQETAQIGNHIFYKKKG